MEIIVYKVDLSVTAAHGNSEFQISDLQRASAQNVKTRTRSRRRTPI